MKVAFTKFIAAAGESICKRVDLSPTGEVVKTLGGKFFNGEFQTVVCDWAEFGPLMGAFALNECLCLGTSTMKDKAGLLATTGPCGANSTRRTKQNFGWNAKEHGGDAHVVLLDIDEIPPGCHTAEDIVCRILEDVPELGVLSTGFWAYPSAGACIYNATGQLLVGLSGLHVYFALPVKYDVDVFKHYLRNWMICQGQFKIKENSNAYLRAVTYIDTSAIGPERVDYIGGSECGPGLKQLRGEPVFLESEGHDDLLLGETELWSAAKAYQQIELAITAYSQQPDYIARREAYAESVADKWQCATRDGVEIVKNLQYGIVKGSMLVHFDSGKSVPAADLLLTPDLFDGQTMADPRDDKKSKGKAKFYANSKGKYAGRPMIHGFKGGEMFFDIQIDLPSVKRMVANKSAEEVATQHGIGWWRMVSENSGLNGAEVEEIFGELQVKWKERRTDMQKKVMSALLANDKKRTGASKRDRVNDYNARYSCVRIGDDVRIVWEEFDEEFFNAEVSVEMSKSGFFDWMAEDQVWDIDAKGKTVSVAIAKEWWSNPSRKKYNGITFAPWTREREVMGKLNMYRGFSADAISPARRPCQGRGCDGKGCLHWFLTKGVRAIKEDSDPCSPMGNDWKSWGCGYGPEGIGPNSSNGKRDLAASGCTWWFRTLYENLCDWNLDLFIWSLDWIADMFQNPADRKPTAFVMQGPQGIGKGLLVKPLSRIYRRHYYQAKSRREITGRFNLHLQHLILLFVDEATWGGDVEAASVWKNFVSEEVVGIEKKGKDIVIGRNFARVMVASNNNWVVAADMDDRRHFILTGSDKFQNRKVGLASGESAVESSRGLEEYWRRIAAVQDGALLDELLKRQITSNLSSAPITEGLLGQKRQSMGVFEQYLETLLEGYPHAFDHPISTRHLYHILREERLGNVHYTQAKMSAEIKRFLVTSGCAEVRKNITEQIAPGIGVNNAPGFELNRELVDNWFYTRYGD